MKKQFFFLLFVFGLTFNIVIAQTTAYKFDFGTDKPTIGYIGVNNTTTYSSKQGFGFLPSAAPIQAIERHKQKPSLGSHFITSEKPFYFSVDLPEGNYDVRIFFGDKKGTSLTTVKVENRRLMLEKVKTKKGKISEQTFTVNIRSAAIQGKDSVKLKPREYFYLHWDNKLTFEFCEDAPKVAGIEITPNTQATTVFLAGNSTVVDQYIEPFAAWGQMIPRFFTPLPTSSGSTISISIANHAESGETLKSFVSEKRLEKLLGLMKAGDYLFIEFAHNDQKLKDFDPYVGYKDLLKYFISEARKKGGKPVLVTSMHRRSFDSLGRIVNTLGNFPDAMRQTAKEENVPLIDLHAMSKTLWEALGTEGSKKAFVHFPLGSFPGQEKALEDDTHFSNYGAYLLAQCMVEGIRQNVPELAVFLKKIPKYDPSVPTPFEQFSFPLGALVPVVKPDGN
jgi:lysophospholipase L1-like esterase